MVHGVFNAVFVTGNMLGDSMYYGRGAGKLPTASAVVSDVIDCARHQGKVIMCFWDKEEVKLADIGEAEEVSSSGQRPERKMRLQQRSPEAGWYILAGPEGRLRILHTAHEGKRFSGKI